MSHHADRPRGGSEPRLAEGKLPAALLAEILASLGASRDPQVLIPPAPGRDVAVIDLDPDGDRLLVLTADPVTLASQDLGRLAVSVNVNDVATAGATPRFLLATVLLPAEGTPAGFARDLVQEIDRACRDHGIALVGGHTEVTSAVVRPVVSAALLGEVSRSRLVRADGGRIGDVVLCTRGVPMEGACILARERRPALIEAGVRAAQLDEAASWSDTPGLSILSDARAACDVARVHAMHDPTEGGLATALHELADASGLGIEVDASALPVLPPAKAICDALGLDPLGLIASGALLLAVAPGDASAVIDAVRAGGSPCVRVARLLEPGAGRTLRSPEGAPGPLPRYDQDELAKLY